MRPLRAMSRTSSVSRVLAGATTSPVSALTQVVNDDGADQVRRVDTGPRVGLSGVCLLQALGQRAVQRKPGEQRRRRAPEPLRPLALSPMSRIRESRSRVAVVLPAAKPDVEHVVKARRSARRLELRAQRAQEDGAREAPLAVDPHPQHLLVVVLETRSTSR